MQRIIVVFLASSDLVLRWLRILSSFQRILLLLLLLLFVLSFVAVLCYIACLSVFKILFVLIAFLLFRCLLSSPLQFLIVSTKNYRISSLVLFVQLLFVVEGFSTFFFFLQVQVVVNSNSLLYYCRKIIRLIYLNYLIADFLLKSFVVS